ncbi:MAG: PKD domain-containing protein [Flavobacteriales bacterium]|nr:PKD domain-containing protein [Flavobacteriales bacterium]
MRLIKNILIVTLFLLAPYIAKSTHVVGGSLTYEHLGGSTYRITFKMYRDCSPSSVQLPNSVRIEVRQPNGASFSPDKDIVIPKTQVQVLNPPIDTCAFDPGICVEEAIYSTIVNNLPPNPGGYHLFFQTCCRNASLVNCNNPLNTGESFYTFIPDNSTTLTNSSPQWKNFPPVYVCQGNPLVFDHGATDKDGDSLAYSFYNPFDDNAPTFPGNVATFTPITYNGGYTANNPLGGGGFVVNPTTGVITGTPPALGQYVVGVKVDEYRNGVKINTVYRDFQFNVINCPPLPYPGIGPMQGCSGTAVNFTNTSTPLTGNSFYWDFGDLTSTSDTSNAVNPSYTYPSIGTYVVMLVAQAHTPCADTIYDTLVVSGVTPDFTLTDSTCVNTPVNFNDISTPTANATINSWQWDFGDGGSAVTPNPGHTYTTPGTYPVQLIVGTNTGCMDSITKNIFVQGLPQAVANDTFACISNPVTQLNGMVSGASGGIWTTLGSGSFSPNNSTLNPTYSPSNADTAAGFVTLILSTTGNGFCPSHSDTMILSFSIGITANAGPDIAVCKDTAGVPLSGTILTASGGQWVSSGTGTFSPNPFDMNAVYIPSSADTTSGSVLIYLNSIGNGNCVPDSDTLLVTFTSTPTASIMSNDTACAGFKIFPVSANSTTGSGYWQTLGSGNFTPSDSLNSTGYLADSLDNFNGSVTLIFTSTNNGGCKAYSDTLNIALIPAPGADFNFASVCPKDTVFFLDNSNFTDPIISWDWDFNNGFIDNLQNTATTYDTAGTYNVSLIVESANGCIDTIVKPVLIYANPDAQFNVNGVCQGVGSVFADSSSVSGSNITSWYWDFGDGNGTDTAQNPLYVYNNNGIFNVSLIVQSAQGCWDTIVNPVTIQSPPTANYSSAPTSVKIGENFNFTDLSFTNIVSWYWDFGDTLGTSILQHPTYNYSTSGNFTVCLRVTDNSGCMDSICNDVIVFMPPQVPNAFSPNGQGANNVFSVLGGPYKELEFKIYNNWGELIFESNDQAIGWDGTRNGEDQPVGVYVYTVRAVTLDDEQHTIKGDVTLLR